MSTDGGLRKEFKARLCRPDWLLTPIETAGTVDGVPDTYWAHVPSRRSGWLENKRTAGWAVAVRPHQVAWHVSHAKAGVRTAFAVRAQGLGSAAGAGDSLWLVKGSAAPLLAATGLQGLSTEHVLGRWYGAPRAWDWPTIARLLLDDAT